VLVMIVWRASTLLFLAKPPAWHALLAMSQSSLLKRVALRAPQARVRMNRSKQNVSSAVQVATMVSRAKQYVSLVLRVSSLMLTQKNVPSVPLEVSAPLQVALLARLAPLDTFAQLVRSNRRSVAWDSKTRSLRKILALLVRLARSRRSLVWLPVPAVLLVATKPSWARGTVKPVLRVLSLQPSKAFVFLVWRVRLLPKRHRRCARLALLAHLVLLVAR
jgi:hypothetical protein